MTSTTTPLPAVDEIIANFELLEDSHDRLEYLIELGRAAQPLPREKMTEENRVRGCASQVWLDTSVESTSLSVDEFAFPGWGDDLMADG